MTTNSPNISEIELQNLYQLFPQFVTDGKFDYEAFKAYMNDEIETSKEPYKMTRHGKSEAKRRAKQPSILTLRPQQDLSTDRDTTKNLFIEGDNGEVLKLLLSHYYNKVKMIYIDPPYNKDKDFVYSDTRKEPLEAYLRQTGQRDDEGATDTDIEKSGRKHSNWLNMMYPRLWTARKLLKDDGVIFVSIDDDEVANLRKLMDEIFGEENFIAKVIRNTNSSKNQSSFFSISHDYCLIYAKNSQELINILDGRKWEVEKNNVKEYVKKIKQLREKGLPNDEITNELKELTKYPRFIDFTNYRYFDEKGVYRKGDLGGVKNGNTRPIINPLTGKEDPVPPGGFRYVEQKLNELIKEDRIHFHTDGSLPTIKRYLDENLKQRPKGIMSDDQRPDYSLLKSFGIDFDNPKQLSFMKRIVSIFGKEDLFLDFFAGSGTTAHAVMDLNKEDGGNRKWICVQLPEVIDEKEEAYKAGYRTISQLSRARIDKVIEKYTEEGVEGDLGYRALTLDKSNFNELNPTTVQAGETTEEDLNTLIQQELATTGTIAGRTDMDIIYELILRQGVSLHARIEQDTHGVYTVSDDTKTFYVNLQEPTPERIHARIQEHQENKACTLYMLEEKLSESQRINLDEYVTLITL